MLRAYERKVAEVEDIGARVAGTLTGQPSPRPLCNERDGGGNGAAKAQEIFSSALELRLRQRDAFLAEACTDDDAMNAELHALLTAHEGAGGFMQVDEPFSPDLEAQWARLKPEGEGERIGRYKLLQEIGEKLREFVTARLRRVFGSADHPAASRTWDRAGAAQE